MENSVVRDRFTGTAVITAAQAFDIGALGYVARASGVITDARHDHPMFPPPSPPTVPTHTGGDVLARFHARAEEIGQSIALVDELVTHPDGRSGAAPPAVTSPLLRPGPWPGVGASGVGMVEGWRGTIVHRVEIGPDHRLTRVKVVDPSFLNWPALPVALADTIVPDFPLVNKSFNLSYAGNDL